MELPREVPDVEYRIDATELFQILGVNLSRKEMESLLTRLRPYEKIRYRTPEITPPSKSRARERARIEEALFYFPRSKRVEGVEVSEGYHYLPVAIKHSTIEGGGFGAFAHTTIPKGVYGFYQGIPRKGKVVDILYSWEVSKDGEKVDYYVDASNPLEANWTRYVNTGGSFEQNNLVCFFKKDRFYYKTLREISKGEELFVDYGEGYRHDHLGIYYSGERRKK